jgi:hypothetical protein
MKQYLTSLPVLVAPDPGETPFLYLAATAEVKIVQRPVYYVSEVLCEAKARYPETHKLLYAILIASRKLRHYFQAHKIVVVTCYPLRAILHNTNTVGNIAKWAAELAGFQLNLQPCHAIKSYVLTDFVVEWTPTPSVPGGPHHGSDPPPPEVRDPVFTGGRSSSTGPHATRRLGLAWSSLTQTMSMWSIWWSSTLSHQQHGGL